MDMLRFTVFVQCLVAAHALTPNVPNDMVRWHGEDEENFGNYDTETEVRDETPTPKPGSTTDKQLESEQANVNIDEMEDLIRRHNHDTETEEDFSPMKEHLQAKQSTDPNDLVEVAIDALGDFALHRHAKKDAHEESTP